MRKNSEKVLINNIPSQNLQKLKPARIASFSSTAN